MVAWDVRWVLGNIKFYEKEFFLYVHNDEHM